MDHYEYKNYEMMKSISDDLRENKKTIVDIQSQVHLLLFQQKKKLMGASKADDRKCNTCGILMEQYIPGTPDGPSSWICHDCFKSAPGQTNNKDRIKHGKSKKEQCGMYV